jgi:uncharacterized protein with PIN domain
VQLRFFGEINEFLAPDRREREFEYRSARAASVKNAIEAVGVPHTEIEAVIVNGEPVDFSYLVREGDRICVYPCSLEAGTPAPVVLRPVPSGRRRFVADSHLGGLARLLRMLGYDTLYSNAYHDSEVRRIARDEDRAVLTRDRDLLICRDVVHGCFVHALRPEEQLREVVSRLRLEVDARPFTRCLDCNEPLSSVDKAAVAERIPPNAAKYYDRFASCPACGRIYWEGSHWKRMNGMLESLLNPKIQETREGNAAHD